MKKKKIIRFLKLSFILGLSMLGINDIVNLIGIVGYIPPNWKAVIINVFALGPTVTYVLKKISQKKGKDYFFKFLE